MKYYLIADLLWPAKIIICFEAVFRVFAIVKMSLDNLLKGDICKKMTGSFRHTNLSDDLNVVIIMQRHHPPSKWSAAYDQD